MGATPPGGFKIGATAQRMQAYLGLPGPTAGFMPSAGLHDSGAVLRHADFMGPGAECELCVRLARDLPPARYTPAEAASAVGALAAAIEIVENRYGPPPAGDLKALGTPTLIADQVYHAAAVLGTAPASWRSLDLAAIPGRILVDGVERDRGRGGELLGHPMAALAWLAGSAVPAAFGGLRAGQVVMLGSVVPTLWLDAPCTVEVRFDGLPAVQARLA
jgi:2-keto-4-pentenoate hydratase